MVITTPSLNVMEILGTRVKCDLTKNSFMKIDIRGEHIVHTRHNCENKMTPVHKTCRSEFRDMPLVN